MTLPRGVAVVSIDTELAWGDAHRRGGEPGRRDYGAERDAIARVLAVFERHEISATWAVVGHLFADHCDAVDGRAHPDIVRPEYPWLHEDWYAIDPCSTIDTAPEFYGRDIVEMVANCRVPQEIGSHSFSHLIASGCSAEAFASDLAACRSVADGRPLRSFVFPRNAIGHLDLLGAHGFTCYRGSTASGQDATGRVQPIRDANGLWNVPQTYLFAPATRDRRLPVALWTARPIRRLRQAARDRSLFHLWFHPYNVTAAPDRAIRALDRICRHAARLRDAGGLDVLPMGVLAERLS